VVEFEDRATGCSETLAPSRNSKIAERSAPSPNNQSEEDFTIRTTSRLVLLDVSVKAPKGEFVGGLGKENVRVFENGKLQEIKQFANSDIPVTLGIVVDDLQRSRRPRGRTQNVEFEDDKTPWPFSRRCMMLGQALQRSRGRLIVYSIP